VTHRSSLRLVYSKKNDRRMLKCGLESAASTPNSSSSLPARLALKIELLKAKRPAIGAEVEALIDNMLKEPEL
jgi:hypothetical protein